MTIVKDTTPGVHFRHSYDKIGRVTNVVVGDINIYTVKVLFENYSEEVDELWLKKYDPGMANTKARVSKKQRICMPNRASICLYMYIQARFIHTQ